MTGSEEGGESEMSEISWFVVLVVILTGLGICVAIMAFIAVLNRLHKIGEAIRKRGR